VMVAEYVDVLFLTSTAYLVQSQDGRVVILCYRGTPPTSLITWLTDLEVDPVKVRMPFPKQSGEDDLYAVHGGFYRNVRSTRHEIIGALQRRDRWGAAAARAPRARAQARGVLHHRTQPRRRQRRDARGDAADRQ
jgi:hypothetical protein